MDELELLKKSWNKDANTYPKLTYNEIYKMILKKSSSIVKWIFIISLLEFIFWTVLSLSLKDSESMKRFEKYNAQAVFIPLMVIGYIVLAYFFYLFFKNYKTISATDNTKVLMENILKTRKTVKYYVGFNLMYLVVTTVVVFFLELDRDPLVIDKAQLAAADGEILKFYAVFIIATVLVLAVAIGVLLLFYWLIYGILLKRLNQNYKELKKLEV